MNALQHRTAIKWLHWSTAFLILYFLLVEPHVPDFASEAAQTAALATHAGMGALLGLIVLFWTILFAWKGPAGKPGPKLRGWKAKAFGFVNRSLYFALPVMMATGLSAGLLAPYLVLAFGLLPLNFGVGSENLHDFAQEIHELAFNGLLLLIILHVAFHIWRQFWVRDHALKMILPRMFHKVL